MVATRFLDLTPDNSLCAAPKASQTPRARIGSLEVKKKDGVVVVVSTPHFVVPTSRSVSQSVS